MGRKDRQEIVIVDGGDSSVKWLFFGTLLGAGLALLYAPRSGDETRRSLQRGLWKMRAMTEEKVDELMDRLGGHGEDIFDEGTGEFSVESALEDIEAEADAGLAQPERSVREELQHRLADARARRGRVARTPSSDEEPIV